MAARGEDREPAAVARWCGATTAPRAPRTRPGTGRAPALRHRGRPPPGRTPRPTAVLVPAQVAAAAASAIASSTNDATKMPSRPATCAATPPSDAADDLPEAQEHRVEAHDRAAVVGVGLGHVREQADGGRGRAGEDEQPAAGDATSARSSGSGVAGRVVDARDGRSITAPPDDARRG